MQKNEQMDSFALKARRKQRNRMIMKKILEALGWLTALFIFALASYSVFP
jgi:hypothetical protein